jgi:hypothetical protein
LTSVWVLLDCDQYYPSGSANSVHSSEELARKRLEEIEPDEIDRKWDWCIEEHEVDAPA